MLRFALLPSQISLTINPSNWCSLKVIRGQYNFSKVLTEGGLNVQWHSAMFTTEKPLPLLNGHLIHESPSLCPISQQRPCSDTLTIDFHKPSSPQHWWSEESELFPCLRQSHFISCRHIFAFIVSIWNVHMYLLHLPFHHSITYMLYRLPIIRTDLSWLSIKVLSPNSPWSNIFLC